MPSLAPQVIGLVFVLLYSSCASSRVDVIFYRDDGQRFSWLEQWRVESIADATVDEVAALLPDLPASLILRVHQGPDTASWVPDVLAVSDDLISNDWMSRHPDGRRRVGPQVGVYLVERAMAASGMSADALVAVPTDDIVAMALTR